MKITIKYVVRRQATAWNDVDLLSTGPLRRKKDIWT